MKIPLFKVNMPKNIDQVLKPVLDSGFISEGPKAKEFETKLQEWMGNPYVALTNSGTAALTIALRLAGVGPGDEVISSPMTCLSSNESILSVGGKIVWCDVDPTTGNIDPTKIEKLITSKTKAILFVDWGGTPAELLEINAIAIRYGLKTIEDAAHALGAGYRGIRTGNYCDYTCFSFQAIKHLTTVDGGAIACLTQEDYERAILLRWFGCKRSHSASPVRWTGDVLEYGYKMHMNDVNATIGLESLKTIDSVLRQHRANGNSLQKNLVGMKGLELLSIPNYIQSAFWIFTIKLKDSTHRTKVSKKLDEMGIGNNIVHTRNDAYTLFKDSQVSLPGMDDFGERMLNIPCGWWMDYEDVYFVAKALESGLF